MTEKCGERFTGHGPEWQDAKLAPAEARIATAWVEQKIDKRSMLTQKDRVEDVRDAMWQLEKDGEIVVHRVLDEHQPVMVKTLYGWDKKIPTRRLWHHKSCGQCGNIPGYPASHGCIRLPHDVSDKLFDVTSRGTLVGGFTVAVVVSGLGAPLVGRLLDAEHARRVIDVYEQSAAEGRGVVLYMWTGMRGSDAVRLGWTDIDEGGFSYRAQKTRRVVMLYVPLACFLIILLYFAFAIGHVLAEFPFLVKML